MAIVDWGGGLTTRTRSWLVSAVLLLLLANAFALAAYDYPSPEGPTGGNPAAIEPPDGYGAGDAPGGGLSAQPSAGGGVGPTSASGVGGGGADGSASSPAMPEQTTTTSLPPYTYEVTLEPTCVAIGEDFTVTLRVEPSVGVAVVAAHADGKSYNTQWGTTSGPEGTVVHTWKAPPMPGPGKLLTGATTLDGRLGSTTVEFRIVEVPGTC